MPKCIQTLAGDFVGIPIFAAGAMPVAWLASLLQISGADFVIGQILKALGYSFLRLVRDIHRHLSYPT